MIPARKEWYTVDLLNYREELLGELTGVTGGSIEWAADTELKSGGRINLQDTGQIIEWMSARVRCWYHWDIGDGEQKLPLGVYIPVAPKRTHTATGSSRDVELLGKLTLLAEMSVTETLTIVAGAKISDEVRKLLTVDAGEANVYVEDSDAVLRAPMSFDIGTTYLSVINQLLDAANYFSLRCDGFGQFRAEKYVSPDSLPVVARFEEGENSTHLADYSIDIDLYHVPNKVILVSRADGETAPLMSMLTVDDVIPSSPFAFTARHRWVARVDKDVEAASQAVLDDLCRRRLMSGVATVATLEFSHAVCDVGIGDKIAFVDGGNRIMGLVTKMTFGLQSGTLVQTTVRELAHEQS